jgi:hypothetical protein
MTYGDTINLGDDGILVMGNRIELSAPDNDGLIKFLGAYYGDMSIMSSRSSTHTLDRRWNETFHTLQYTMEELPLHLNSPVEWIKIYAAKAMGGYL